MTERDTFVTVADGDQLNEGYFNTIESTLNSLGEVRTFAVTISGANSIATLRTKGWAVCDGSTGVSQGITSPDITASTPNLTDKFIRGNATTSGTTSGSDTHTHTISVGAGSDTDGAGSTATIATVGGVASGSGTSDAGSTLPAYYTLVFMMKVKLIIG